MISQRHLYKIESIDGRKVTLSVAKIRSVDKFPPAPREALTGLLTGWRMLLTGLGYHDLPVTLFEAHELYHAAHSYERMATLYANYCPHIELVSPLNYIRARAGNGTTSWYFGGRFFKGGREWISWQEKKQTYALMSVGHIFEQKASVKDESGSLLRDFEATMLGGAGLPAARIQFRAGENALVHFMRPGMVWEYTDEFECPHCLSNAVNHEIEREQRQETLTAADGSQQQRAVDIRQCRCSLCGGIWKEDISFFLT
jgi:hypothetical protein